MPTPARWRVLRRGGTAEPMARHDRFVEGRDGASVVARSRVTPQVRQGFVQRTHAEPAPGGNHRMKVVGYRDDPHLEGDIGFR